MTLDEFWEIVEKVKDSNSPESGVKLELNKLSPEEVMSYQKHFDVLFDRAYIWDLWGAAYLIGGGCSDDGFIDFRYGLISKGKNIYEKAIQSPDSLAKLGDDLELANELFGYAAQEVYEELTGSEMPLESRSACDNEMGEEWDFEDEDENRKRLPNLVEIYWE